MRSSAPNSIADIMWRNSPQFQLINMADARAPVRAMLSYGERDDMLSKRHLTLVDTDKNPVTTARDNPMLNLYVMKANVPDKRYVGWLSPQAENYASHSMSSNQFCVQSKWDLDPGDVYCAIAVMNEATTHEVCALRTPRQHVLAACPCSQSAHRMRRTLP